MPHFCNYCGHICHDGYHGPDGRFVVESVTVTDAEIMTAQYRSNRGQGRGSYSRTRRNIAFGKHVGVYRPEGWPDETRGPATYITVGAFA